MKLKTIESFIKKARKNEGKKKKRITTKFERQKMKNLD
jgi:hypothetical protein